MSRIIFADGGGDLPFGLYSVGAQVVAGGINVLWSTGIKATTTMYYSINDDSVDKKIGPILLQPGDEGYIPGQDTPNLQYHHIVPFPQTFVDAYHYFQVESTNPGTGNALTSDIYRIFLTNRLEMQFELAIQPPEAINKTFAPVETVPATALGITTKTGSEGGEQELQIAAPTVPAKSITAAVNPQNTPPTLEIQTTAAIT